MRTTHLRLATLAFYLLPVVLFAATCRPSTAAAARHWRAPVDLGTATHPVYSPQVDVAVSPDGDAVAVWQTGNRANGLIKAAGKPKGGSWSTPTTISTIGKGAQTPQVGIDAEGNATVVWESAESAPGPYVIWAASKPVGGPWSAPTEISGPPFQAAVAPQLAVNPDGEAVAVWVGAGSVIQSASKVAGGSWSAPVNVSSPAPGEGDGIPEVALDAVGDATAVWQTSDGGRILTGHYAVQAATRPAGASWSAPVELSTAGGPNDFADVAMDPAGDATVVWTHYDSQVPESTADNFTIEAAARPVGGSWSAPMSISPTETGVEHPKVAMDAAGDTTAVWERSRSGYSAGAVIEAAERPAGGFWSGSAAIAPGPTVDQLFPQIAVDHEGDTAIVWDSLAGAEYTTQTASRTSGGSWSAPVTLSAAAKRNEPTYPQVALDEGGDGIAAWELLESGRNLLIQAAELREGFSLTTTKVGTGLGTVASSPAGIDCGAGCPEETADFEAEEVTLTASPAPGYLFHAWKNCDSGTTYGRRCAISAASVHKPVGVEFRATYNVTLTKAGTGTGSVITIPAGVSCTAACIESSAAYLVGQSITLKATPSATVAFAGWSLSSGACALSEEGRWCTFTPSEDTVVEAEFAARPKVSFSISKEGGGQGAIKSTPSGISCGITCDAAEARLFADEEVTLAVTLGKGTSQITWVDGAGTCTGHATTCQVPASAEALVARFD